MFKSLFKMKFKFISDNFKPLMNILIFIIITNLLLIPSVVPLTTNITLALSDMYNEWGSTLKWSTPTTIDNVCNNNGNGGWSGISCNIYGTNVIYMFVN